MCIMRKINCKYLFFIINEKELKKYWHWQNLSRLGQSLNCSYDKDGNKYLLSILVFTESMKYCAELGVSWVTYNYYKIYKRSVRKLINLNQFMKL